MQFSKCEFFKPNVSTLLFIISTNALSLPATYSPRSVQASFAEAITTALNKSFTVIFSPTSSQICEPPLDTAFSVAATSSVSLILPLSIASSIRSIDINFVTEAGERCSYALFCLITSPVSRLISILDFTFDFLFSSAFAQMGKLSTNDNTNIKLITLFIKSPTNIYYNYLVLITIF